MIIVQYWHAEKLPLEIVPLVESFRLHNTDAAYHLFNEATAEQFIAEHFSTREVAAFRACAVPAMQADYLRYCATLILGGIYADADMKCLTGLQPLLDSIDMAEFFTRPKGHVGNSFFAVRAPGHPMLRFILDVATINIERRTFNNVWLATGPAILSTIYWLSLSSDPRDLRNNISARHPDIQEPLTALLAMVQAEIAHRLPELAVGVRFSPVDKQRRYVSTMHLTSHDDPTDWRRWPGSIYR